MTPDPTVRQFLRAVFDGQVRADQVLSIGRVPKGTKDYVPWLSRDLDRAISHVEDHAPRCCMYFGMGLLKARPPRGRGKKRDIAVVVGLAADIDFIDPHKEGRTDLPADAIAAAAFIDGLRLKPSAIINSGHGLQAHWLFEQPLPAAEAERLAGYWHTEISEAAAKLGVRFDSVKDSTRVMRIPGTTNFKHPDDPLPVKLLDLNDDRFTADHFGFAPENKPSHPSDQGKPEAKPPDGGEFTFYADATAPPDKLEALLLINPKLALTWTQKRTDLKDGTPSANDYAIVNALMQPPLTWTDQEIIDTIIEYRRIHNNDPQKALRPDYAPGMITKIREEFAAKKKVLLRLVFGLKVKKVEKLGEVNAVFDLILEDDTRVPLGTAGDILRPLRVRDKIFDVTGVIIQLYKPKDWVPVAQAISDVAVVRAGVLETEAIMDMVITTAASNPTIDLSDVKQKYSLLAVNGVPSGGWSSVFKGKEKDGKIYYFVKLRQFATHAITYHKIQTTETLLGRQLARLGFETERLQARQGKETLSARFWKSPANLEKKERKREKDV